MTRHLLLALGLLGLGFVAAPAAQEDRKDTANLVRRLQGKDVEARAKASLELVRQGKEAVPALLGLVEGKDEDVAGRAIDLLGRIGPAAADAVPALGKIVKADPVAQKSNTLRAMRALGQIGPKAKRAVPELLAALKAKAPAGRGQVQAAMALGQIGPEAKEAVPALTAAVKTPTGAGGPLCFAAATALGRIGPGAKEAVPALADLLKDRENGPARLVAAQALGKIGPGAKEAVPMLAQAADDPNPAVAAAARQALEAVKGKE
jgi:HEAT repeat protein